MRLTIIRPSNQVYINGDCIESDTYDMSLLPEDVRVIQWFGDKGRGHIEFYPDENDVLPHNQPIDDITNLQPFIDEWNRLDEIRKRPYVNTAEDNKNIARVKLYATDYVYLPDVNILNKGEFDSYRATIRDIFFNPVDGSVEWPTEPAPVWG